MPDLTATVAAGIRLMTDDQYEAFCRDYLTTERLDPRTISQAATASGTDPTVIDFGSVPPGIAWELKYAALFTAVTPWPTTSGVAIGAAIAVGRPPFPVANFNPGDVVGLTVPITNGGGVATFPGKAVIVRAGVHVFALVGGTAAAVPAGTRLAGALSVVAVPDTLECLAWL